MDLLGETPLADDIPEAVARRAYFVCLKLCLAFTSTSWNMSHHFRVGRFTCVLFLPRGEPGPTSCAKPSGSG